MSKVLEQEIEVKTKYKKPPKYCVVMINDNLTTFEFVILVIQQFFNKTQTEAINLANLIHQKGSAVVGSNYDLDVAETKVKKVHILAQSQKFPLQCKVQPQSNSEQGDA